jgi:hypothetical protein
MVTFYRSAAGAVLDGGGAKRVELDTGQLLADIAPQPPNLEMTFATPDAEAKVLGTHIRLTALPKSSVLEVARGEVEFKRLNDPATAMVSAGQRIDSLADRPLLPRTVPPRSGPIPLPLEVDRPEGLAHDGQNLWVSNGPFLYKINTFDGAIDESAILHVDESATLDLSEIVGPQGVKGLAWDGMSLWVADYFGSRILRMDPVNGTIENQFSTLNDQTEDSARSRRIQDVAVAGGYLWGLGYGELDNGKRGTVVFQMNIDGKVLSRFDAPEGFTYFAITRHEDHVCLHGVGPDRSGRIFLYPAGRHDGEPINVYYGAKANSMVTGLCSGPFGRLWLVNAAVHDRAGVQRGPNERWIQAIEFTDLQEVNQP